MFYLYLLELILAYSYYGRRLFITKNSDPMMLLQIEMTCIILGLDYGIDVQPLKKKNIYST